MMREASKVMIGAAGVRANGNVSSRCGTASVCMMAHYYRRVAMFYRCFFVTFTLRVPVMVLCQTFKFTGAYVVKCVTFYEGFLNHYTESVLLDSFCDNEIGQGFRLHQLRFTLLRDVQVTPRTWSPCLPLASKACSRIGGKQKARST